MRKLLILFLLILLPCSAFAHPLLDKTSLGSCSSLTGSVQLIVIYVDTPEMQWSPADRASFDRLVAGGMAHLETEAAAYGVSLTIEAESFSARLSEQHAPEDLPAYVLVKLPELCKRLLSTATFHSPILFCMPGNGRDLAFCATTDDLEYAVLYANADEGDIQHELLHLYGAEDYYIHDDVRAAAMRLFPDSIMLNADPSGTVDSLTAWSIGWTEQPDADAERFLAETAHLTPDMLATVLENALFTGYGTKETAKGVYTGMMQDGLYHGQGTFQWTDGRCYTGQWAYGELSGQGTLTWPDGSCYTGDYVNGERSGQGTYTWPDGSCYTGGFVDGERSGQGTFTWADGSCYTGDFVDGKRSGQGTMIWSDGTTATGIWKDGELVEEK